jgi:HSP20 family protein
MVLVPTVDNLQREINRVFDGMLARGDYEGDTLSDWTPPVDIVERENEFVINVDLPGLERKDIHVGVENSSLSISGERPLSEANETERSHREERPCGTFKRVFSLPRTVDAAKVKAEYRDGVLSVRVPKAEEARPREIEVKVS